MIRWFLYIKRKFPSAWAFILFVNNIIFNFLFASRIKINGIKVLNNYKNEKYTYRFLTLKDLYLLREFLQAQDQNQFTYFNPHKFDKQTLKNLLENSSSFLFGVFNQNKLIGYFFLRCYINKKCFIGRIVDKDYQGQGIAKKMSKILYHIAWSSNFRIFSTISKYNISSLKSHQAINNYKIIKELDNDYYLIEYIKSEEKSQ